MLDPDDLKKELPFASPIQPKKLTAGSTFQFHCHKDIACFNACCKNIDITLTPYDILRLKKRLQLDSREFVARYTMPFEMDAHGMPGLKMATKPGTTQCVFLCKEGCSVYQDRPAACRYYALGSMGVRAKDSSTIEDMYFIVKESHCLGHNEKKTQTVVQYRKQQGLEKYDDINREWRDIVIKKRSSGPTIGTPSPRSMQLFDMCSYDLDSFAEFIQSAGFRTIFDLPETEIMELTSDDEKLLAFAMRFLKQVLFGEQSIPIKPGARDQRIEARKERKEAAVKAWREQLEDIKYGRG